MKGWRKYFQILMIAVIIVLLFLAKLSWQIILFITAFLLLLLIFKSKLYKKIDKLIRQEFKLGSKLPNWVIKLIITAIFLLVYMLIKNIIFIILGYFGLDIPGVMMEGINNSMIGQN